MRSVATVERKDTLSLCESATLGLELNVVQLVSGASSHVARNICTEKPPTDTANPVYEMFTLTAPKPDPLMVVVRVNQVELPMEVNTGASMHQ